MSVLPSPTTSPIMTPPRFVHVMRRNLYSGRLKVEELVVKIPGNSELGESSPCLLRQVVGDLDIDLERRDWFFPRPTLFDDLDELIRNIDAPTVTPAVLEPLRKFLAGIMIQQINVQFPLMRKAGLGKVAASQVADRWG